ncbi:MAG: hypothetical protein K8S99_15095 [Planctomycetes bacterium]|nr:hypothetical protein [Planctomycetota bacterium]
MAESNKENKDAKPPAEAPAAAGGKKLPMKAIMVLAVALIIEGVAISAAFMIAGKPAAVHADPAAKSEADEAEKPTEMMVISDKFQNNRSGRSYIIDTEIYAVVRRKNQSQAEEDLKGKEAMVAADITMIFRKAEPNVLLEPSLSTLTRQIQSALEERLGTDSEKKPIVEQVLIKKFTQIPIDP